MCSSDLWLKDYAYEVRRSVEAGEVEFRRYSGFDEVIDVLFPELAKKLSTEFGLMAP